MCSVILSNTRARVHALKPGAAGGRGGVIPSVNRATVQPFLMGGRGSVIPPVNAATLQRSPKQIAEDRAGLQPWPQSILDEREL